MMLISKLSKRPGLHDVAKVAGCPYRTVPRIANNDAWVSGETRERALAAIEVVRYRRNMAVRALVISRPGAIDVVSGGSWRYGPMGTLHGVEEAARNVGHSVLLIVQEWGIFRSLEVILHWSTDIFADGIVVIVPLRAETKAIREVVASFSWASGLPVVILISDPRPTPDIRVVTEDQKFGARLATRYLV